MEGKNLEAVKNTADNFKSILPKDKLSGQDIENFTKSLFKINDNNFEKQFIPSTNGNWTGEPGNSKWIPDPNYVPQNTQTNPEQKTIKEIFQPYGIDGITFKNFEPDFTPIAKESFKIKNFSEQRNKNFKQGDLQLAIKMGVSPEEAKAYRKEHRLTYHERSDMKTLDLVPIDAHGAIPHKGGIAKCKELNEKKGNES